MEMHMILAVVTCVLVLLGSDTTIGQTYNDTDTLMTDLLNGYNAKLRPVLNASNALTLNITADLYNVLEVDTVKGAIITSMSLACNWYDEKLTWTPAKYNNVNKILLKQSDVWIPELVLGLPADSVEPVASPPKKVTYLSNGLASWFPQGIYQTACSFNLKYWPYDKQICEMMFYVSDYLIMDIVINTPSDGFSRKFTFPNGEWKIEDSSVRVSNSLYISTVIFRIKLRRYVSFHFMTINLPLLCICFLSSLVFLLPVEDRVGYSLTMLLSMTVFLSVVSDSLPKVADPMPLICNILGCGLVCCALIVLFVILNSVIYHREAKVEIASGYKLLVKIVMFKWRKHKTNVKIIDNKVFKKESITSTTKNSDELECDHDEEAKNVTWQEVSYAIDRVLFCVMTICSMTAAAVFIIYLPAASEYQEPFNIV